MLYQVVCTSRSPATRFVRATNPTHRGLKQFIGGTYRVIRGRPLVLPEEVVREHLVEIQAKYDCGMLALRTEDGREVNPHTMVVPPPPPAPPKPTFVEVVDVPVGTEKIENVPEGIPQEASPVEDGPDIPEMFSEAEAEEVAEEVAEEAEAELDQLMEEPAEAKPSAGSRPKPIPSKATKRKRRRRL